MSTCISLPLSLCLSVSLSLCLSVSLSLCLYVSLSLCLSSLSVSLSLCLSVSLYQVNKHKCAEASSEAKTMEDAAGLAKMAKKLGGRKCPNPLCTMFIIKNAGCDFMMCGDRAHGNLTQAIRNGGCGCQFRWSTNAIISSSFTNIAGERVNVNVCAFAAHTHRCRPHLNPYSALIYIIPNTFALSPRSHPFLPPHTHTHTHTHTHSLWNATRSKLPSSKRNYVSS